MREQCLISPPPHQLKYLILSVDKNLKEYKIYSLAVIQLQHRTLYENLFHENKSSTESMKIKKVLEIIP